jgi:hypothetical protein
MIGQREVDYSRGTSASDDMTAILKLNSQMNATATPEVLSGPINSSTGLKMPPPTPVNPGNQPIARQSPARTSGTRADILVVAFARTKEQPPRRKPTRVQRSICRWVRAASAPPMNDAGIEVITKAKVAREKPRAIKRTADDGDENV